MQVKSNSTREDLLYRIDEMARFATPNRRGRRSVFWITSSFSRWAWRSSRLALGNAAASSFRTRLSPEESFLDEVFGRTRNGGFPASATCCWSPATQRVPERYVVLIDEIDKAPRDTPNDLLEEFDRMAFAIPELDLRVVPPKDAHAPGRDRDQQQREEPSGRLSAPLRLPPHRFSQRHRAEGDRRQPPSGSRQ